jgi:hypothetical protein
LLPILYTVEKQHPHLIRKGRAELWRYLWHGSIVCLFLGRFNLFFAAKALILFAALRLPLPARGSWV